MMIRNLIFHKIFILISAAAFFCLEFSGWKYLLGLPFALVALFFVLRKVDLQKELESTLSLKLFSLFNAVGTCVYGARDFIRFFNELLINYESRLGAILRKLDFSSFEFKFLFVLSACFFAVIGFYFVYVLVLVVTKRLLSIVKRSNLLDFSKAEKISYSVLFVIFVIFIMCVYLNSNLFFPKSGESIFSADSSSLIVSDDAFLDLTHHENDIRQPLFAIFSLPFSGIPYLISLLLPFSWSLPLFTAFSNLLLLIFSATILARLLHLDSKFRIFFVILTLCTFSNIMFSLIIEQYIVGVFYFLLFIYVLCEENTINAFSLYAATGTLSTSCVASLFSLISPSEEKFSNKIKRIFVLALGFVFLMIALCRSDIFIDLKSQIFDMLEFSGSKAESSAISMRILQFVESAKYYFVSPILEKTNLRAVNPVPQFSLAGTLILALSVLSIFINRKKTFARFCAFWLCFNFLLTCVLGWGVSDSENTLFLYSLYFGWVYLALIFMLLENALSLIRAEKILPVSCVIFSCVLLALNIPSMKRILDFAFTYYPL